MESSNFQGRQPGIQPERAYEEWIRQTQVAKRKFSEERVYQISRLAPGDEQPLVIASCGKASAQRFLAAVAIQQSAEIYKITACFDHPSLPGFER